MPVLGKTSPGIRVRPVSGMLCDTGHSLCTIVMSRITITAKGRRLVIERGPLIHQARRPRSSMVPFICARHAWRLKGPHVLPTRVGHRARAATRGNRPGHARGPCIPRISCPGRSRSLARLWLVIVGVPVAAHARGAVLGGEWSARKGGRLNIAASPWNRRRRSWNAAAGNALSTVGVHRLLPEVGSAPTLAWSHA